MRTISRFAAAIIALVAWCSMSLGAPAATSASLPRCSSASVSVTDYNTLVGAGHVNDLFWIKDVGHASCTVRGYVRATFIGVYGEGTPYKDPQNLTVRETHLYGRGGNYFGGISNGRPIPTVTLRPGEGVASFWLDGTDETVGNPPGRCIISHEMLAWLPGSSAAIVVHALRDNGFFWCGGFAALPILSGKSGTEPPRPLSYYFGVSG